MIRCNKGHVMTPEVRSTWTDFKTLVCHHARATPAALVCSSNN